MRQLQLAGASVLVLQLGSERGEGGASVADVSAPALEAPIVDRLDGVDKVVAAADPHQPTVARLLSAIIDAAPAAGVSHLIRLSDQHAGLGLDATWLAPHEQLDERLAHCGVPYTILKTALPASTLLETVGFVERTSGWAGSAPSGRNAFIDPRDVATALAAVAMRFDPLNAALELTGPEALTYDDAARMIGETIGRPVTYRPVEPAEQLRTLVAAGFPRPIAKGIVARDALTELRPRSADSANVAQVTGRPAGPLAAYLEDYRCAFTGDGALD